MNIIYLLIPLSILLVLVIAWFFVWSVKNNQFDDLDGQGHRILLDNDDANSLYKPDELKRARNEGTLAPARFEEMR